MSVMDLLKAQQISDDESFQFIKSLPTSPQQISLKKKIPGERYTS